MDKLIITTSGIAAILGIYLFFFGKKEKAVEASGSITIAVEGGYKPKLVKIPTNQKTTLIFLRKDINSCLEELIIPDYKIKKYLPMHTPVVITLSPKKPGTYNFHCGMNMFHGTIEVM
jgi:plastocyanin domain-containing protein